MSKLNCLARNCVNNEGGLCDAEYILIKGANSKTTSQTYCSNFRKDNILNEIIALGNTNYIGEIKQMVLSDDYEIKMSPMIKCDAHNCIHNVSGSCKAHDVSIMGSEALKKEDTCCETFVR